MEDCRVVINENDQLREQLSIKNRELLKITKERAEHAADPNIDNEAGEDVSKNATD